VESVLWKKDLRTCLDRQVNLTSIGDSAVLSGLTKQQQLAILESIVIRDRPRSSTIEKETYLFLSVIEGCCTVSGKDGKDDESQFSEGQFDEIDWLTGKSNTRKLKFGFEDARVGILTAESLLEAMKRLGIVSLQEPQHAVEFLPKLARISKLPVFETLTQENLGYVAQAMKSQTLGKGDHLMKKGDMGKCMYIVQSGDLKEQLDGDEVMRYGPGDILGEKAFVKEEPLRADVTVASDAATLWCIENTCMGPSGGLLSLQYPLWPLSSFRLYGRPQVLRSSGA